MDWYSLGTDETPDIPIVFILSVSSAEKSGLIIPRWTYLKFILLSLCRPNDKGFVIEEHRGEILKEVGQKKERTNKSTMLINLVNLRINR